VGLRMRRCRRCRKKFRSKGKEGKLLRPKGIHSTCERTQRKGVTWALEYKGSAPGEMQYFSKILRKTCYSREAGNSRQLLIGSARRSLLCRPLLRRLGRQTNDCVLVNANED
jgi:hypothetical protein